MRGQLVGTFSAPSCFAAVSRVSRQFRASFAQFRVVRVVSSGFTCCFTVLLHRFRISVSHSFTYVSHSFNQFHVCESVI